MFGAVTCSSSCQTNEDWSENRKPATQGNFSKKQEDVVSTWAWRGLDGGLAITTKVMHDFAEALYRPGVHWPERFMKRNPELKRQTLSSPTSSLSDWCEPAARGAATGEPFIGRLNGEATVHPGIFQWTGGKLGAVEELHAWLLKNKEGQSKLLVGAAQPSRGRLSRPVHAGPPLGSQHYCLQWLRRCHDRLADFWLESRVLGVLRNDSWPRHPAGGVGHPRTARAELVSRAKIPRVYLSCHVANLEAGNLGSKKPDSESRDGPVLLRPHLR